MMLVTNENLSEFTRWLEGQREVALDTETDGLYPFHGNKIVGVSLAAGEQGWYLPFGHGEGPNLSKRSRDFLFSTLAAKERLITFNGSFDLNFLYRAGFPPLAFGQLEEVQVAAHLFNENDFNHYLGRPAGLKELADKYLGPGSSRDEAALREQIAMRFGKGKARTKAWKGLMWNLPAADVEPYATADALLTLRLRDFYRQQLAAAGLLPLYQEMCDYTLLLQGMTYRGIRVNRQLCERLYQETLADAERAAADFRELVAIPDFNLNSAPQLHALFGEESVRADLLKEWSNLEEGVDDERRQMATNLLLFRAADKMHGSYFAKYLPLLDRQDRLHATFNVTGTETGRLSCSNPNLQAIPRDVKRHKVKLLFTPAQPDALLVEMDYSQAEIRLASFYGKEYLMAEHLAQGRDIHTATAELIGCDRDTAKRINFSAIYGIGPKKYSATYGVPLEESERNLRAYHETYKGFRSLYRRAEELALTNLCLRLPSGRYRHYTLPYGQLTDPRERLQVRIANATLQLETHKASSNLVQGMVAALLMKAMLRIARELPEMRMVLTVHDSLIFDVDPLGGQFALKERDNLIGLAKQIMEDPVPGDPAFKFSGLPGYPDCPMKVDVKTSTSNWGEAVEWSPKGY